MNGLVFLGAVNLLLLLFSGRLSPEIMLWFCSLSGGGVGGYYLIDRLLRHRELLIQLRRPVVFQLPDGVDITDLMGSEDLNRRLLSTLETKGLLHDPHRPTAALPAKTPEDEYDEDEDEDEIDSRYCRDGDCDNLRDPRCAGCLCARHCKSLCASPYRMPCVNGGQPIPQRAMLVCPVCQQIHDNEHRPTT